MKEHHSKHVTEKHRHLLIVFFDDQDHCPAATLLSLAPCICIMATLTQSEISEDGNATVPIVGGVDGEDGGDSGVASAHQNETVVQHCTTATLEELTPHELVFGEELSATVISFAAHASASTTQEWDDDDTNGERLC